MFIQRGQGEYYSTQVTISDPGRVCFIQNNRKPCLIQVEHSLTVLLLFPHCGAFAKCSPQELLLHSVSHVSICLGLARITSGNSDASQHPHRKRSRHQWELISFTSCSSLLCWSLCLLFIYSELSLAFPWFGSDLFGYF